MIAATKGRSVYPARRAVEHVAALDGIRPLRLFPVLWPLWRVETSADVYDEQDYDVIDRFVARAIAEAGLGEVGELASFFGIPAALVRRCLAFLTAIGHVQVDGNAARLTELGFRSLQAGVRYEPKESRQDLFFERFTARALPRDYYEGSIPIFPTPEIPADRLSDRSRFIPLFAATEFQHSFVHELARRSDRADFNLPNQLRDLRVIKLGQAFLPAYLIENADSGLLVYTARAAERDTLFEAVCLQLPTIHRMIDAEDRTDQQAFWNAWLADGNVGPGTLRRLPNGVWRAILRSDAFGPSGKLPLSRLGSYELRGRYFLQLWSDDPGLRRQTVMDRTLAMTQLSEIKTNADLGKRIAALARQLEVSEPDLTEIRRYGEQHDMRSRLARLDALA